MLKLQSQEEWARRAAEVLPGAGFGNFDPSVFIKEGKGARVIDEDGNAFIDYLIGSGPMILGKLHARGAVGKEGLALRDLLIDRLQHFRVAVAEDHGAGADQIVDERVAVLVDDARAL
ncbi:MAG: hypothetical protein AAFV96_04865, partial [Pseudomonadota bacterium]